MLGLDQEHRDPEAIEYEATHSVSRDVGDQEAEPSCEIEINSVNSADQELSSPQSSMIALFEKHSSELNIQRKQRNTVPMPRVSAISEESLVKNSETEGTSVSLSVAE